MNVPLGSIGRVTNSTLPGHCVRVDDDHDNTGGFLIFEWWIGSNGPNERGAFDSWVETLAGVVAFIEASDWEIDWDRP